MEVDWIAKKLRETGKSRLALAQVLGVDVSTISKMLRGKRRLQAHEIPLIEQFFGEPAPNVLPMRDATVFNGNLWPRDIEVRGVSQGELRGSFSMGSGVVDHIRRPPGITSLRDVLAIYTPTDTMRPWRQPGEPVYITTAKPPRDGDHVVVELKPEGEGAVGACYLACLVGRTPSVIRLAQYHPSREFEFATDRVRAVYRVIEWAELMGA